MRRRYEIGSYHFTGNNLVFGLRPEWSEVQADVLRLPTGPQFYTLQRNVGCLDAPPTTAGGGVVLGFTCPSFVTVSEMSVLRG